MERLLPKHIGEAIDLYVEVLEEDKKWKTFIDFREYTKNKKGIPAKEFLMII